MQISCTIELQSDAVKQIATQIEPLQELYPQFNWLDSVDWRLFLYTWHDVEPDLVPKLQPKLDELLLEIDPFNLFGVSYRVFIQNSIEVRLEIQDTRELKTIEKTLNTYFAPTKIFQPEPYFYITLAKYKTPSKQQYSHLKNNLAKVVCDVESRVNEAYLLKITDFGRRQKDYELVGKIEFQK